MIYDEAKSKAKVMFTIDIKIPNIGALFPENIVKLIIIASKVKLNSQNKNTCQKRTFDEYCTKNYVTRLVAYTRSKITARYLESI